MITKIQWLLVVLLMITGFITAGMAIGALLTGYYFKAWVLFSVVGIPIILLVMDDNKKK